MSNQAYESITLEAARFYVEHRLSSRSFYGAPMTKMQLTLDHVTHDMVLHMERTIWAEPVKTHTVRYPQDWWQSFKSRWFPAWALAKWPVVETVHTLDIQRLYPEYIWKEQRPSMRAVMRVSAASVKPRGEDDYDSEFYS